MARGSSANATSTVMQLDTERTVMNEGVLAMLRSEQDAFLSGVWVNDRAVFTTTLTITGTAETNTTKVSCTLAVYDLADLVFDQTVFLRILSKQFDMFAIL